MKTLIFLVLISVLIISISNTIYLRRIYRLNKTKKSSINDERYFEIKYNMQLYVIIFSLIIATASFLGYDKFNDISSSLDSEFKNKISQYDSMFVAIDTSLEKTREFISDFEFEKEAINATIIKAGSNAKTIEKNINILATRKVNTPNLYVIKDVKIYFEDDNQKIYYKDLRTFDGKKLPIFSTPPFINIPSNYSIESEMVTNTKDYFQLRVSGYTPQGNMKYNLVDIWIVSNE